MKKKAFTLIELLVVIAIIANLAAILFPVFAQARESAKKTEYVSNTKQLSLAQVMYAWDHDEQVLPHSLSFGSLAALSTARLSSWSRSKRSKRYSRRQGFVQLPLLATNVLPVNLEVGSSSPPPGWIGWISALIAKLLSYVTKERVILLFVTDYNGAAWPNGFVRLSNGLEYAIVGGKVRIPVPTEGVLNLKFYVGSEQLEVRNKTGWVAEFHVSVDSDRTTVQVRHKPKSLNGSRRS